MGMAPLIVNWLPVVGYVLLEILPKSLNNWKRPNMLPGEKTAIAVLNPNVRLTGKCQVGYIPKIRAFTPSNLLAGIVPARAIPRVFNLVYYLGSLIPVGLLPAGILLGRF